MSDLTSSDASALPDGRPVARWLALATALTLLDAVATALWLELGVADEGNPLLARLADLLGAVPAMAIRAVVGVALLVGLAVLSSRSRLARVALPGVTVVLAGVALWHAVGGVVTLL
jgi:hypothetical protein